MSLVECAHCHKAYKLKPSAILDRNYCSRECKSEATRTRPLNTPRACAICETIFKPVRGRGDAKFCSKSCIWKGTRGSEFNAMIARASASKRADSQRGRGTGKSYRKLFGRHEHRVVAERMLGRPLQNTEIVHHEDGNHLNNDPSNLEVITQGEHMQRHGLGIPGMKLPWKPWEKRRSGAKNVD